ncbi:acyl-CoA dehydrogenase family protein [Micromonospora sp. LOL_024]
MSVSLGLVAKSIAAHGVPEQRRRWLPRLCVGDDASHVSGQTRYVNGGAR